MRIIAFCTYCSKPFVEGQTKHQTPQGPCCSECKSNIHWQDGKQDPASEMLKTAKVG